MRTRSADRALDTLVAEFNRRATCLVAALEGVGLKPLVQPNGGYFVWIPLPDFKNATTVLELAKKKGVSFLLGSRCDESNCPTLGNSVRLCFAFLPPDELEEGVRRLAEALAEC